MYSLLQDCLIRGPEVKRQIISVKQKGRGGTQTYMVTIPPSRAEAGRLCPFMAGLGHIVNARPARGTRHDQVSKKGEL